MKITILLREGITKEYHKVKKVSVKQKTIELVCGDPSLSSETYSRYKFDRNNIVYMEMNYGKRRIGE